jgi:hypothetical protein
LNDGVGTGLVPVRVLNCVLALLDTVPPNGTNIVIGARGSGGKGNYLLVLSMMCIHSSDQLGGTTLFRLFH